MKCYKSPEWFQVTNSTLGIGKTVPETARNKYRGPDVKHVEVFRCLQWTQGCSISRDGKKNHFMEQTCTQKHNSFLKYVYLFPYGF